MGKIPWMSSQKIGTPKSKLNSWTIQSADNSVLSKCPKVDASHSTSETSRKFFTDSDQNTLKCILFF